MKKAIFSILSLAAVLVACNPIEIRDSIGGHITAEELASMSKVTVLNENGKNVNWVTCETSAPVSARWSSVTAFQGAYGKLQMFATGEQTVRLQALCADGTLVETEFKVQIDEMAYPVAEQWGMLTGGSQKVWGWDSRGNVWGNGGYQADGAENCANGSGEWWGIPKSDIAGQTQYPNFDAASESGDATMTFVLQGTQIIKSNGGTGTFAFDMTPTNGSNIGTLTALGCSVLFPCKINSEPGQLVTVFEITRLTNDNLDLIYAPSGAGAWSEATHWHFAPVK